MTTAEAYIELHAPIASDAVSVCILHTVSNLTADGGVTLCS